MAVTKLYNKITLREHPDLSPVADASFEKGHSFIFPGDEIVACTKLKGPADFGGSFNGITLQSVKMSIIAKKPNIFTEEFSEEFTATRSFELDSVEVPLNASNAPFVPWGADGYAPNINFTQNRNWQLPLNDFRRQVKAFTTHVASSSDWYFNFWFPLIFREEYWNALASADNDFYDTGEPQNGKNQKWLRYHNLSTPPFGWKIYYRFELFYKKFGVSNSILSEWNLSNEQEGIQDYGPTDDWDDLEVKTCKVGGTPSNTPTVIYADQDTSCFGYMTKQSLWQADYPPGPGPLTAIFRIRPLQGGDRLGSRASSKYPVASNVVWADMSGYGTIITIDGFDITVEAKIDHKKLKSIFPGVNNFALYCRLYNSESLIF